MRKITLELNFSAIANILPLDIFSSIQSLVDKIEAKSFLKIDMQKGIKTAIIEFTMKDNYVLEDIPFPPFANILNILDRHNNRFLVLIQIKYESSMQKTFSSFGIDELFYDTPAFLENDRLVFSIIGEKEPLSSFLSLIKKTLGDIKILNVQEHTYTDESILSKLTERQKEILTRAKQLGYYEIPRKITTLELAKEFGISKAAILEHLRKAEGKIMMRVIQ